jgi:hypothetical protein
MPKYTLERLKLFAIERGGECLSISYKLVTSIYRFRCHQGHEFQAKWNDIRSKSRKEWCHECQMQACHEENKRYQDQMESATQSSFSAFKAAFDLKKLSDSLVSCDGVPPTTISDDDYSRMHTFLTLYADYIRRYASYPFPKELLMPITDVGEQRERKKRLFCLQSMAWITSGHRAFGNNGEFMKEWLSATE